MPFPFHYRHSGLVVASALELPEWEAFGCDPGGEADVEIAISDEPCPDCPTDGSVAVGEALRFAVEGIGGWQVEGGRRITLHPGLTAAPPELRLFTLGSAWGALGYQRGFAMWHGSAVARSGRAILFCGDAGAGKSTMAGAMLSRGSSLVADDLSRIEPGEEHALIHPSSARIKLWREAIGHFGWEERILQRDYYREDKFHCSSSDHLAGEAALPLVAIVTLEEGEQVSLDRLAGAEALGAAMKQTMYRPEMIEALGTWGEQGALGAQIAAKCPVYRLTRPKDFDSLARACGAAEGLWGG
ncbi:hypothetical protein [Qipengyuania gelatinilytica]|uniref:Serine kinase n=1 Tax=Qipengyuania gelatinilytica TaxID=2867231 RepID=A0ABX9A3Y3_9SPHN|nr:hypothetical protein [Qipengyuania gelatinilytica]QZD95950.1 hypothetical protein K3136_04355 [Qipengyuania gelatinilytica]